MGIVCRCSMHAFALMHLMQARVNRYANSYTTHNAATIPRVIQRPAVLRVENLTSPCTNTYLIHHSARKQNYSKRSRDSTCRKSYSDYFGTVMKCHTVIRKQNACITESRTDTCSHEGEIPPSTVKLHLSCIIR